MNRTYTFTHDLSVKIIYIIENNIYKIVFIININHFMKNSKTIDEKHSEMLSIFTKNKMESIPSLKEEIENLKIQLRTFKKPLKIDEYMDTKDKITLKQRQIKQLENEEKQYFLDNSKYIFDYFEQKKDISSGSNKKNTNVLNSFFKIHSKNAELANPNSLKYNQSRMTYQNYWKNVTNDYINIQDYIVA